VVRDDFSSVVTASCRELASSRARSAARAYRIGAPSLVGEILVGVLLGPPVLDFVPNPGVLMLVGEVGLVLLVVEAGLHVDVEMLEIIGARGLAVGLLGSALPLALALTAAYFWGATLVEAFAVAACMATTVAPERPLWPGTLRAGALRARRNPAAADGRRPASGR